MQKLAAVNDEDEDSFTRETFLEEEIGNVDEDSNFQNLETLIYTGTKQNSCRLRVDSSGTRTALVTRS